MFDGAVDNVLQLTTEVERRGRHQLRHENGDQVLDHVNPNDSSLR